MSNHWRNEIDSPLLGAYSLSDGNEGFVEMNGVITHTGKADFIMGASGKQKVFIGYTNIGKPIKLNATISKAMTAISGTSNPTKWVNIPVCFYVDKHVKFGKELVEAIRIKKQVGAAPVAVVKPDLVIGTDTFTQAKAAVDAGTYDLAKLKIHYNVSEETQIALGL